MTKTLGFGLLLTAAVQAAAAAPVVPAGASPTAIRTMKGVTPEVLKIQDQVNKKEWCAHVVEVLDGKEACKTHQCSRPFDYGKTSKTGLKKGMRAIELAACDTNTHGGEMLLWGPANLMLLNTDRPLESGLWEQVTSKRANPSNFRRKRVTGLCH
jgi:hypothetical protein